MALYLRKVKFFNLSVTYFKVQCQIIIEYNLLTVVIIYSTIVSLFNYFEYKFNRIPLNYVPELFCLIKISASSYLYRY